MFDNYGARPAQPATAPPPTSTRIVRFDKEFFYTTSGILKIIQLVTNFVGFICIKISSQVLSAILYNMLYWIGNIITFILLVAYMFHFVEKFERVPWLKFEFFFCVAMTLAYFGCSIFALLIGEGVGYAVGFFGFCAVIAYGLDGYLKFRGWRRGLPAQ